MKNAYFAFKNRQNAHFLKKKSLKNLVIQKKVVPLHPHSEECSLLRGITAEIAQLVEHNLAKVGVAGPSPVFRSIFFETASSFRLYIEFHECNTLILEVCGIRKTHV